MWYQFAHYFNALHIHPVANISLSPLSLSLEDIHIRLIHDSAPFFFLQSITVILEVVLISTIVCHIILMRCFASLGKNCEPVKIFFFWDHHQLCIFFLFYYMRLLRKIITPGEKWIHGKNRKGRKPGLHLRIKSNDKVGNKYHERLLWCHVNARSFVGCVLIYSGLVWIPDLISKGRQCELNISFLAW